ncbi:Uncharacterized protein APZ42_005411 [Daphnia magna]|uniref:Uncharacterized protein n=1 Tax=Daphnia magna TaxID=35525 RepID=A0A0P5W1X0_9CRUS|nr:Uncharacterized protein APZ42_005411 [Daphnia magna]
MIDSTIFSFPGRYPSARQWDIHFPYIFETSSGEITNSVEFLLVCQLSRQLFHFAWLRTKDGC